MTFDTEAVSALRQISEFKPSKGNLKRLEIIKASIECLATIGFDKTTYESIAKIVGTRRAHINYYFSDKNEIVLACVKYIMANYQNVSMEHIKMAKNGQAMLLKYIESPYIWAQKYPSELKVMLLFYYLCTINDEYKLLNDKIRKAGSERIAFILKNYFDFDNKKSKLISKAIQNSISGFMIDSATTTQISLKLAEKRNKDLVIDLLH